MKKQFLIAAVLATSAFVMAPEAMYSDVLAQWGPAPKAGGGWGPAPTPQPAKAGTKYTVVFTNFAEANKETDKSSELVKALEGIKNVFSVDFDKATGTATIVMNDKNTLSKANVEKAIKGASLTFEVEKLEKIKDESNRKEPKTDDSATK